MINGNGQQQPMSAPPAFDGRTEVPVTLQVNTWNVILSVISKAPWETADPLIQELRRQITASLEPSQPPQHQPQPLA